MGLIMGVDLGGTFIKAGLVSEGRVVASGEHKTGADGGRDQVIENVVSLGRRLLAEVDAEDSRLEGICIAVPAPISFDRRTPVDPPNLGCMDGVPIAELVGAQFDCPGVLENDANAAALGEKLYGAARGSSDFVCLTLGSGLGGGVVSDGKLLRGRENLAGEVGHITVQPDRGRKCGCKARGCAESYVSIKGLLTSAKEHCPHLLDDQKRLVINGVVLDEFNGPPALAEAARIEDEDGKLRKVFEQMGRYLGIAIADLVKIFGSELIVLSGGLSHTADLFQPAAEKAIKKYCGFKALKKPLRVVVSSIVEKPAVLGAAAVFEEAKKAAPQYSLRIGNRKVEHPVLALQIGATRSRAAIVDAAGKILGDVKVVKRVANTREESQQDPKPKEIIRIASELGKSLVAAHQGELSAIVLIVPGGVERVRGSFRQTPRVSALSGYSLQDDNALGKFGLPIYLENDANAALLYDYRFGNAQGLEQVLGLHLVSGIGGAMILNDNLLIGRHGHALEVGHVALHQKHEKHCGCGPGAYECLEVHASGSALERFAENAKTYTVPYNYMDIVEAADGGNREAETLLREHFAKPLADGVAGILNTFDPQAVIFTGALSRAKDYFIDKLREVARAKCFLDISNQIDFRFTGDSVTGELRAAAVVATLDSRFREG